MFSSALLIWTRRPRAPRRAVIGAPCQRLVACPNFQGFVCHQVLRGRIEEIN